jgi:antitoxin component of RelBE/YafQ-DinJ toxin-antitoxin module
VKNDQITRLRLPKELKSKGQEFSSREGISFSELIRRLLEAHLVNQPLPAAPKPVRRRKLTLSDGTKIGKKSYQPDFK